MTKLYVSFIGILVILLAFLDISGLTVYGFWIIAATYALILVLMALFERAQRELMLIFLGIVFTTSLVLLLSRGASVSKFAIIALALLGVYDIAFFYKRKTFRRNLSVDKSAILEREIPRKESPKVVVTDIDKYIASKNGKVYHTRDCPLGRKISPEHQITFSVRIKGLKPHSCVRSK